MIILSMRKIVLNFLFIIFLTLFNTSANAGAYGKGEIKLSPGVVDWFIEYIRGKSNMAPGIFYVTVDGSAATYWYCGDGLGNCQFNSYKQMELDCERAFQMECKAFARKRSIKWKNGINPGKGKESKISTRMSNSEIRNKLKDLGFIN